MRWAGLAGAVFLAAAAGRVEFRDVAAEAGLTASFPNGGNKTKRFIVETTGSGAAFLDYDNDGLPDVFLVSGEGGLSRLYHNDGNGRFTDVTAKMGLDRATGWGQGVCAADYDNDGYTDLFVTYWGQNHLYRNVRGERFEDVTARAGLRQDRVRYNTGCAFLDYDRDGHADLFVANYLKFDPATTPQPGANPLCFYRGLAVACGPRGLPFDRNILYHNNGDGTFTDVSEASGVAAPDQNYSLGVVTGDFNGDGLTDIYVACDRTPSLLYINLGKGKFGEEAVLGGVAFDADGRAMSGMGAAAGDYDGDGLTDLFRSNFSDERETLYRNRGGGEFDEVTAAAGLARNTRYVGWGCGFFDFDNDGRPDLLLVNGHVFPEVDRLGIDIRFRDHAILYRNLGGGKFEDITAAAGRGLAERQSARGAAFADYDNDGAVEVLINNQNAPPTLLRQTAKAANHWITLKLVGTRSNRSALGAKVRVVAGALAQTDEVRSGGSYLSQNDLRLHFGLGAAAKVDRVEIEWPSGGRQVLLDVGADRVVEVTEPRP